jgi:hypothetical protein
VPAGGGAAVTATAGLPGAGGAAARWPAGAGWAVGRTVMMVSRAAAVRAGSAPATGATATVACCTGGAAGTPGRPGTGTVTVISKAALRSPPMLRNMLRLGPDSVLMSTS